MWIRLSNSKFKSNGCLLSVSSSYSFYHIGSYFYFIINSSFSKEKRGHNPIIHKTYTQTIRMQERNKSQVAMYEHAYQFTFNQYNLSLFS